MSIVYVNGSFVNANEAKISIFDSGFIYGDGIYEVALLYNGKIIDLESHFTRLTYVLTQVKFNNVPSLEELKTIFEQLVQFNANVKTGMLYLQITRGVLPSRYAKPQESERASIIAYLVECNVKLDALPKPIDCALVQDPRRERRDIKMISLMPMVLAKYEAIEEGFNYVIFKERERGAISEGASSNLFIVNKKNEVLTHPTNNKILAGCTRKRAIEFLKEEGFVVKEEEFFEEDLLNAKEAFITGAIKLFVPIGSVNGKIIGEGKNEVVNLCLQKYSLFVEKHI